MTTPPQYVEVSPFEAYQNLLLSDNDDDDDERRPLPVVWLLVCCILCCGVIWGAIIACTMVSTTPMPMNTTTTMATTTTTMAPPSPTAPTPAPTADCCPADPFVYENSPYASSDMTLCATRDYNCDGVVDELPCCYADEPQENVHDARTMYLAVSCNASLGVPLTADPLQTCGACTGSTVLPGWACSAGPESSTRRRRKRFVPPCPGGCEPDTPQDVTAHQPPDIGECALYVDRCIPPHGGDGEQCCIVVSQ